MPVIYFRCSGNVDLPVVIPPNDLQSAECASDTVASDFADKIGGEPLGVRELEPSFQRGLQDALFGGQIFVPRQQLLIHRPSDVGQDARPIH